MSSSVFALVVMSAALHAMWNLLIKRSGDKLLMTVGVTMSAGIVGLLSLPFFPAPAQESWVFIAASALLSVAYFLMVAATYKVADMSLAYPVIRGSAPLLVGLAGMVLFGEYLPLTSWIAIIVISSGIMSMALAKHEHGLRGLVLALITAVLTAACTLIDAEGARRSQAPAAYTLCIFAGTGLLMAIWAATTRWRDFGRFMKQNWHISVPAGVGALCSYGTALWAMTLAPVAMVAALRETTVLFGAALAWFVLKERIGRSRLIAILAIAGGAALLRAT
jgi:drug/metabolite transporter (DMT)-like permease